MPHSEVHGDDLAIIDFDVLVPPGLLRQEYPLSQNAKMTITKARNASADVITGEDDRVLVIVGPCSIHNAEEGLEVHSSDDPTEEATSDSKATPKFTVWKASEGALRFMAQPRRLDEMLLREASNDGCVRQRKNGS